jgi:adenylate cyclase
MTLDVGARGRLEAAFAREERRGLMQAAAARSVATAVIIGWLAAVNPERGLSYAWVLGTASFFLATGLAQFWLYWRGLAPPWVSYAFIFVDSLALAAVLLIPNPFATQSLPLPVPLRYASFMYFFVLLMQAAFSFRPRLLVWTGLSVAAAWTIGFLWIASRPETLLDPPGKVGRASMLAVYLDPNYASILKYQNEIVVFLLVARGSRSSCAARALWWPSVRRPSARAAIWRATSRPRSWTPWPSATSRWGACAASRSACSSPISWASRPWPRP